MTSRIDEVVASLRARPRRWLVTGVAGFIGSHLLERLLSLDQAVVGLDNFSTGRRENVAEVLGAVSAGQRARFRLVEGDARDLETCRAACGGAELVLHQAALGSVPRSIEDPLASHANNVDGFANVLVAARDAGVARVVYASSSAVYGDHPALPKVEEATGAPLSPYALTKAVNELYAGVFQRVYGTSCIGLRYFNVFGPRQDPNGPYAAVIPRWAAALVAGEPCRIHGDGQTSRDFTHVANAVQANLLAATAAPEAAGRVYNVACGERTTLNDLFAALRDALARRLPQLQGAAAVHGELRAGDIRHSLADVGSARRRLGYEPEVTVARGIDETMEWYVRRLGATRPAVA